ncbi:MAG: putative sulfate exporter family transporter, partial [Betaproteobacteria bacterium]|nr:putative sulfate exporter family transporter [Betaproteobacteria bacterium]
MAKIRQQLPGLMLVIAVSGAAYALAQGAGLARYGASSLTLAIVIGALLGNLIPGLGQGSCRVGLGLAQKGFLRAG